MKKILIMGLPGSGKTRLAKILEQQLVLCSRTVKRFNADEIRSLYNDWDFSMEGRIRQGKRMYDLAHQSDAFDYVLCDFVAPTEEIRKIFNADWTIWVDTIEKSRYNDTNAVFEPPSHYDFKVDSQKAHYWADSISKEILTAL